MTWLMVTLRANQTAAQRQRRAKATALLKGKHPSREKPKAHPAAYARRPLVRYGRPRGDTDDERSWLDW
jgi:hypothetical protein